MSDVVNNKSWLIKSHLAEYVKSYAEYDGFGRLVKLHQTDNDAKNGDPTVVTEYAYVGSSTNVTYMREYEGTWQTAWELF